MHFALFEHVFHEGGGLEGLDFYLVIHTILPLSQPLTTRPNSPHLLIKRRISILRRMHRINILNYLYALQSIGIEDDDSAVFSDADDLLLQFVDEYFADRVV